MFATKLDLLSIGTIKVPIHIEPIFKPVHIPNLSIVEPVPNHMLNWYVFWLLILLYPLILLNITYLKLSSIQKLER
jgi:hypothetical protein